MALLIVAGMSGAGRSTASAALEDLGWFVIDNVPAALVRRVAELAGDPAGTGTGRRLAIVIGRGGTAEVPELVTVINELREGGDDDVRVLFLDATDHVLIRRYEGTRRRHPLADSSVAGSIAKEREALRELRGCADVLLETDELSSNQLRGRIAELFEGRQGSMMRTSVVSFGYKFGLPRDVDVVFDCRFLPNPHWVDELRALSGLDEPVRRFVLDHADTRRFVDEVVAMLEWQLPAFRREGKSYLSVAFGCTGGRHRSVAIAEEVARRLGGDIVIQHRDVER